MVVEIPALKKDFRYSTLERDLNKIHVPHEKKQTQKKDFKSETKAPFFDKMFHSITPQNYQRVETAQRVENHLLKSASINTNKSGLYNNVGENFAQSLNRMDKIEKRN